VVAGHLRFDVVVLEQNFGGARIFGGDQGSFAQDSQGAQGNVFQIADGSRHDVECSHLYFTFGLTVYHCSGLRSACQPLACQGSAFQPVILSPNRLKSVHVSLVRVAFDSQIALASGVIPIISLVKAIEKLRKVVSQ
jgi:hypothetical protein